VILQTFTDFELIIVDDGSTDNTKSVINSYSDNRIKSFYKKNGGVSSARNQGVRESKGQYLVFLDSDDTLYPNALETIYQSALSNNFPDIVFSDMEIRTTKGEALIKYAKKPYGTVKGMGVFMVGAYSIRREFFNQIGGFDEKINFGENAELKIRIEKNLFTYCFTDKPLCIYYESKDGGSKNLENRIISNEYIIRKHTDYFSLNKNILKLYLQGNAVAMVRLGRIKSAKDSIWKAFLTTPLDLKLIIRMIIINIPFVARWVWRKI